MFCIECVKLQDVTTESFLFYTNIYSIINPYTASNVVLFKGTVLYVMVSVLMNHLHDWSYLWQAVQSCISCSLWSIGAASEVSTPHIYWLLLVAHMKYCQPVKITRKRRILPGNHEVCWLHNWKRWTGITERHQILFRDKQNCTYGKCGSFWRFIQVT
jgi:hypothetical protein